MDYAFNIENFTKIISADVVPDGADGLSFSLGETDFTIKKPYIDLDGEEMGNSIYIDNNDGLLLSMRITQNYLFVHYCDNKNYNFKQLYQDSPKEIISFANFCWKKVVEEMQNPDLGKDPFELLFKGHEMPHELKLLKQFQDDFGYYYADGFMLRAEDKSPASSWSDNPDFLGHLIPFATANGSGSFYAIWNDGTSRKLGEMPVIVFGDEGGVHIVAESTLQLMHLLTYDAEITVDFDQTYFYKSDEYYQESDDHVEDTSWLKSNFNLDIIENPDSIVENAQEKYKELFDKWFEQYYSEQ
ncbi:hypothetical protein NAL32_17395 [Chryseobacterium sp. Ch-15]|uniref:Uncharacterized protein n=1 Tax=Chryseobacterium muglaense TaxID=2893752 RepID=A0A9Q3YXH9_9FLAO|nr:hypothetical protein [Chryseobacterium muglaense]MBD3906453.1 hypothetical protein [Chryseobacterium muglaense]MCC9036835.1 hypothetical protein [Chryseobacterium muglaense]MCM2556161.1 hypothetical protein [Chryseobacterium muglaense]